MWERSSLLLNKKGFPSSIGTINCCSYTVPVHEIPYFFINKLKVKNKPVHISHTVQYKYNNFTFLYSFATTSVWVLFVRYGGIWYQRRWKVSGFLVLRVSCTGTLLWEKSEFFALSPPPPPIRAKGLLPPYFFSFHLFRLPFNINMIPLAMRILLQS